MPRKADPELSTPLTAEEYLKLSRDDVAKAVDDLIAQFDFKKAAIILKACDWKFVGARRSPTASELRAKAVEIVRDVANSGAGSSCLWGPLKVTAAHCETPVVVTMELCLVPVRASQVYIDGRAVFQDKRAGFGKKTLSDIDKPGARNPEPATR